MAPQVLNTPPLIATTVEPNSSNSPVLLYEFFCPLLYCCYLIIFCFQQQSAQSLTLLDLVLQCCICGEGPFC